MNELTFRQPRRTLILVFGLVYLVVVLTAMIVNFDALAEIVNGTAAGAGAKATGMIVGALVFVPLIALGALATQKVRLRQDAETLNVRIGRSEKHLRRRDIVGYTVNEPRVGSIRLRAEDGGVLQDLHPRMQDHAAVLAFIDGDDRYAEAGRTTAFRGRVNVVTYALRGR